jgi:hypothetical protein
LPNQMTLVDLLRYLHQRILDELAKKNEEELNYLSTTVRELWEAAERYQDTELYSLLDDMKYLLNETLMGAQAKGENVLAAVASKLRQIEDTRH